MELARRARRARVFSPGRLRADLGAPPEGLGPAGRDLVLAHHRAERRAADADARVDALRRTRRYRLAAGLARPLDRLRARLARDG